MLNLHNTNHELFSVSFRYALKYENSFHVYYIDISGSSRRVAIYNEIQKVQSVSAHK